MNTFELIKAFALAGPVVVLMIFGVVICARSGGVQPKKMACNLSRALLVVGACLVGLAAIQQLVGFHLGLLG